MSDNKFMDEKKVYWVLATSAAAVTMSTMFLGFIKQYVYTPAEGAMLEARVNAVEDRLEKRLERIEDKIDKLRRN